jgi:dTDP-4-amino-4,6-dideoxygalactose transaminase
MIPLLTPDLRGNEEAYVVDCVRSNFVSSAGPYVKRFEDLVAKASGSPRAVATSSGTCALHLALLVAGVEPDDLVIVPSLTFIATANAVSHCGATPWLLEVDAETWNLDPSLVARTLAAETRRADGQLLHRRTGRRVAAILPVHGLGSPADLTHLAAIAHRFQLPLVADGAAAIGSSWNGRPIGQLADLTVFSFNGNKLVTCGGGGAIVGSNVAMLERAAHLASTARQGRDYDHDAVGFNYRMTNLEAAVGCAQMERLPFFIEAKRRIRDRYHDAFTSVPGLTPFPRPIDEGSVAWMSGVVVERGSGAAAYCESLETLGIGARPFWKPLHLQNPYRESPRTPMSVSDGLWSRIVTLPCSTWMEDSHLDEVIGALLAVHDALAEAGASR